MNRVILAAAKDKTFSVCMCEVVQNYPKRGNIKVEKCSSSYTLFVHVLFVVSSFFPFSFYLFHSSFVILLPHPYSIFWSKKNWFCFQRKGGRGAKGEQESQVKKERVIEGSQKPPPQGRDHQLHHPYISLVNIAVRALLPLWIFRMLSMPYTLFLQGFFFLVLFFSLSRWTWTRPLASLPFQPNPPCLQCINQFHPQSSFTVSLFFFSIFLSTCAFQKFYSNGNFFFSNAFLSVAWKSH